MRALQSEAEIQQLINDGTEETLTLEYKSADSLSKDDKPKVEITKDVAAMANSAGGTIIYGVREFREAERKHLPERIDPIDRSAFSREWLDQVISGIQPRLEFTITAIPLSSHASHVAYIVQVPQGVTAHQSRDGRYWKRSNTTLRCMDDYEIRDVFNRQKHPILVPKFTIDRTDFTDGIHSQSGWQLSMGVRNEGPIYVMYVLGMVFCASVCVHPDEEPPEDLKKLFFKIGRNTVRLIDGFGMPKGEPRYEPILPTLISTVVSFRLKDDWEKYRDTGIFWKIHGDNAPPREGSCTMKDVEIRNRNKD
jgi:hypothetical protein